MKEFEVIPLPISQHSNYTPYRLAKDAEFDAGEKSKNLFPLIEMPMENDI